MGNLQVSRRLNGGFTAPPQRGKSNFSGSALLLEEHAPSCPKLPKPVEEARLALAGYWLGEGLNALLR